MLDPRRARLLFFACLALVYGWTYPYLARMNNPNETTRVYEVMALVDHGTVRLDPVVEVFGWTNDMAKVPRARGASHLASVKGPLLTCVGVPVYAVFELASRAAGIARPHALSPRAEKVAWLRRATLTLEAVAIHLPCFLFLVWLERRLARLTGDVAVRLAVVAIVGLGTNYLAYSFVFVSHALSSVAAFVALDLVFGERVRTGGDARRASAWVALVVGVALGASTLLELQGLFVSVPLGLYALTLFRRGRPLVALLAGVSVCALVLALFQWRRYGSPLSTGHLFMQTEAYAALWRRGVLGFVPPTSEALLGLSFDRGYGLFGTSPGLWLVALAPLVLLVEDRETRLVVLAALGTSVLVWLGVSSSLMWRGGWTIGPRYLGALPGLLAPVVAAGLTAARPILRPSGARALAGGLALGSFLQMGVLSMLVSTLPESVVRPLPQIVLPFLIEERVPHLLPSLVGVEDASLFWIAPAAAVAALVVPMGLTQGEDRERVPLRLLATFALAVLSVRPALAVPRGMPDTGAEVRAFFREVWEPVRPQR